jgi:hypothetical protein
MVVSDIKEIVHYTFVLSQQSIKHSAFNFGKFTAEQMLEKTKYLTEQDDFLSW